MLKSTYRVAAPAEAAALLPPGWTEHKAPTGHSYYYNAETKQSTYTRPVAEPEELQIDYEASKPDAVMQASLQVMDEFNKRNPEVTRGQGHFTGGRSYQDRSRRSGNGDRPKSKRPIANCEPWLLVTTKFKRRFVHNTETKESLWKFPSEVMMAVIEMEKQEWQAKAEQSSQPASAEQNIHPDKPTTQDDGPTREDEGSDSYEEVEVTDDEDDPSVKRPRFEEDADQAPQGPVDFDEDDIEWQLAQMQEDEFADEAYDESGHPIEDEEGLPLTNEDSIALFRSLLDDAQVSPYIPFDNLLEDNNMYIVEDERWVSLANMSARRAAFKDWSKDRIAEAKIQEANDAASRKKEDPRSQYLSFLQENATPKLYWPEFKRKFRKEQVMKDYELSDKDREKLYREYIAKLKMSDSDRKKELISLLKGMTEGDSWNRATRLSDLPATLTKDIRFYSVRDKQTRGELVEAQIATLNR